jgi:hypothetical protein
VSILTDILPAQYRKALYVAYALAGLILGAYQVVAEPAWLTDALAVYAFVGTALGLTAGANVQRGKHVADE